MSEKERPRRNMHNYQFIKKTGVPMREVLTPAQCKTMQRFLSDLRKAYRMNPELDVGHFMKEYRKNIGVANG
jgi:hypothetical protein